MVRFFGNPDTAGAVIVQDQRRFVGECAFDLVNDNDIMRRTHQQKRRGNAHQICDTEHTVLQVVFAVFFGNAVRKRPPCCHGVHFSLGEHDGP